MARDSAVLLVDAMSTAASATTPNSAVSPVALGATGILVSVSVGHLCNDILQAVVPAVYPMLKSTYELSFTQIAWITFVTQVTASLLQPVVGLAMDKRPLPYALPVGMGFTLVGMAWLALTRSYPGILAACGLIGVGSAVFHPEASRLARLASGGRHGFAQSLFQVGGNFGSALGPLLAATLVIKRGQTHLLWFTLLAAGTIWLLHRVSVWYASHLEIVRQGRAPAPAPSHSLPAARVRWALAILLVLLFSKFVYLVSFTSFYTFYVIHRFHVDVPTSQYLLFGYLLANAAGTLIGGIVGDRIGRRNVIWLSILGPAPLALLLPHVGLGATFALTVLIGLIMASAFTAIVVYGQELLPGKVGLVAGLAFGLAFGIAGVASVLIGRVADATSIEHVYLLCSFLPLLGLAAIGLPRLEHKS